jgi:hypothetical protein
MGDDAGYVVGVGERDKIDVQNGAATAHAVHHGWHTGRARTPSIKRPLAVICAPSISLPATHRTNQYDRAVWHYPK